MSGDGFEGLRRVRRVASELRRVDVEQADRVRLEIEAVNAHRQTLERHVRSELDVLGGAHRRLAELVAAYVEANDRALSTVTARLTALEARDPKGMEECSTRGS